MLLAIHPKLPMRSKAATRDFYLHNLGFKDIGQVDYPDYLMVRLDEVEIHFFSFPTLDPATNDGQVYIRVKDIETWYASLKTTGIRLTELKTMPWKQKEFSTWDPDNNVLTFGEDAI